MSSSISNRRMNDFEGDTLLRAPSNIDFPTLERHPSSYKPLYTYLLDKEKKQYQQQYGDMYFLRLAKLKPAVERIASNAWDEETIAGETVKKVERVLDVRQGDLCWITGTIYMDMPLKPNILDEIAKDHWQAAPPPRQKYLSSEDENLTMLEDESGRLRLIGARLINEILVTGCIVAVMGTENANGDFEVVDIKMPDLPPQAKRWQTIANLELSSNTVQSPQGDEDMDKPITSGNKIAIVSGLEFSGSNADHYMETQLLVEYLLGEALGSATQRSVAQISRLIIAGNSIARDDEAFCHDTIGNNRKAHKKYGYDSSAYNPTPTAHLDNFLSSLLPSIPVTIIPGATDPANLSLPQQPLHPALFPHSKCYGPLVQNFQTTAEPGWLDSVTNPWDGEIEGWRFFASDGQNVDDIFKYLEIGDRLEVLEALCRWRCCAPTAPDTLSSYPFQDDDPFVLESCPHVFIVGSQPKFETTLIEGPEGQSVRLIAVPKFSETGELVLVDTETLETSVIKIMIS